MKKQELDYLITEEIKNFLKEDDVFGQETAIPLSKIDAKAAKAAFDTGKKDGDESDDAASVNAKDTAKVGSLKPMQKEVIPEKALAFALAFTGGIETDKVDLDNMEAIISSDDYIMDGHHRWAARTLLDPGASVGVASVDMPADDVVTALNVFTKAKGLKGKPGKGDVKAFASLIPGTIDTFVTKGTEQWPLNKKTPEELKALISKVGDGDFEKGKQKLIANAKKLPTEKHPNAPSRVDMPVISAPDGDLKKVLAKLSSGEMDIKEPFTKEVKKLIQGLKTKGDEDKEREEEKEEVTETKRWQKLAGIS